MRIFFLTAAWVKGLTFTHSSLEINQFAFIQTTNHSDLQGKNKFCFILIWKEDRHFCWIQQILGEK